jgi:hypothetical protein
MISVLSLKLEAFQPSRRATAGKPLACPPEFFRAKAEVLWPSFLKSPLVNVSSLQFTDDPGVCRLSFERGLDAIFSRSSAGIVAHSIIVGGHQEQGHQE